MRSRNEVMTPQVVQGLPVDGLLPEDRTALQALVDAAYRKAPELRNLDAMRVGKLAEDVERYSALNARLFAEKTAAQIDAENMRELLYRMLEAPTTQISPSWKEEIRPALVAPARPEASAGVEDLQREVARLKVENARLAEETMRLQGLLNAAYQIVGELARPSGI